MQFVRAAQVTVVMDFDEDASMQTRIVYVVTKKKHVDKEQTRTQALILMGAPWL